MQLAFRPYSPRVLRAVSVILMHRCDASKRYSGGSRCIACSRYLERETALMRGGEWREIGRIVGLGDSCDDLSRMPGAEFVYAAMERPEAIPVGDGRSAKQKQDGRRLAVTASTDPQSPPPRRALSQAVIDRVVEEFRDAAGAVLRDGGGLTGSSRCIAGRHELLDPILPLATEQSTAQPYPSHGWLVFRSKTGRELSIRLELSAAQRMAGEFAALMCASRPRLVCRAGSISELAIARVGLLRRSEVHAVWGIRTRILSIRFVDLWVNVDHRKPN